MKNLFLKNPAKSLLVLSFIMVLAFAAVGAHAATDRTDLSPDINAPRDVEGIFSLLDYIFNILFIALVILAGIFIIMAAFSYLTAGGEPEKIQSANRKVIYAAVAVAVGVLAKTIPSIVINFINSGSN